MDKHKSLRVKVWSGSGKEFLGMGNMVGHVPVFFFRRLDFSLASMKDCEEKPSQELIKEMEAVGATLVETTNPKIILDDGNIVYGCQTYWEKIRDD